MSTKAMFSGMLLNDRYRLDDLLSETGAARFWRGTDLVLHRSVAITALPSTDPLAPALIRAARESANVHDPRLLRVLDAEDSGDLTWVVNEWGSGVSLDILVQRGPLDPVRAAWLALETATTIAAAHGAGVCHGRLTPEAVLVTEAGAVKIIGFAVSASIEGGGVEHAAQFGLDTADPAEVEVIDLAGILYAALTGKWPGCSPSEVPSAPRDHRGPLRPRQVRHGIPRMLDALCERALRTDDHEHAHPIRSAVEIVAALNDFVGSPLAGAPIDLHGMHDVHREPERHLPVHDPDATVLAAVLTDDGDDCESTQAAHFVSAEPHLEQPTELPPFKESADRPLFAATPRRPLLAEEPAEEPDGEPAGAPPSETTGKHAAGGTHPSWGRRMVYVLLAAALVGAMVLAYQAGNNPKASNPPRGTDQPLTATRVAEGGSVKVVGIHDFDPLGDPPEEHPDQAPLAIDGDPATGWTTSAYKRPKLGGLKEGVGLVLDLGTQVPVASVHLVLASKGASVVQLRATPTGVNAPPRVLDDLTGAVASASITGAGRVAPASPVTTRYLVVWLTDLPQSAPGEFRGDVREISVRR